MMGLKIEHLDETRVTGTLDGSLPFSIENTGTALRARIASWVHECAPLGLEGAAEMRHAAYSVLAKFREQHKV